MKSLLLVGLGNPGQKFEHTRHNFGVDVLRAFVDTFQTENKILKPWHEQDSAEVAAISFSDTYKVYAVFPLTYMNESGTAVAATAHSVGVSPQDVIIIQDEMEIPFGEWKWKEGGSAAGHNGVRSIHEKLGSSEMLRLRLGIGRPLDGMEPKQYVLQKFSPEELMKIAEIMPQIVADISEHISKIDDARMLDPVQE